MVLLRVAPIFDSVIKRRELPKPWAIIASGIKASRACRVPSREDLHNEMTTTPLGLDLSAVNSTVALSSLRSQKHAQVPCDASFPADTAGAATTEPSGAKRALLTAMPPSRGNQHNSAGVDDFLRS